MIRLLNITVIMNPRHRILFLAIILCLTSCSLENKEYCDSGTWACLNNDLARCTDGNWEVEVNCPPDTECNVDLPKPMCEPINNSCIEGEYRCDEESLYQCNGSGKWIVKTKCTNDTHCHAEKGLCMETPAACDATQCPNGCNEDGTCKEAKTSCDNNKCPNGCNEDGTCKETQVTCDATQCPNGCNDDGTCKEAETTCDKDSCPNGCNDVGSCKETQVTCDATQCPNGCNDDGTCKEAKTSCDNNKCPNGCNDDGTCKCSDECPNECKDDGTCKQNIIECTTGDADCSNNKFCIGGRWSNEQTSICMNGILQYCNEKTEISVECKENDIDKCDSESKICTLCTPGEYNCNNGELTQCNTYGYKEVLGESICKEEDDKSIIRFCNNESLKTYECNGSCSTNDTTRCSTNNHLCNKTCNDGIVMDCTKDNGVIHGKGEYKCNEVSCNDQECGECKDNDSKCEADKIFLCKNGTWGSGLDSICQNGQDGIGIKYKCHNGDKDDTENCDDKSCNRTKTDCGACKNGVISCVPDEEKKRQICDDGAFKDFDLCGDKEFCENGECRCEDCGQCHNGETTGNGCYYGCKKCENGMWSTICGYPCV